jgi:hypothetical protein
VKDTKRLDAKTRKDYKKLTARTNYKETGNKRKVSGGKKLKGMPNS